MCIRDRHQTIAPQNTQRKITEWNAADKKKKRNPDIIESNAHKHGERVGIFIHAKRIAIGNIFFCHIYVVIAQHASYEIWIGSGSHYTHRYKEHKNNCGK